MIIIKSQINKGKTKLIEVKSPYFIEQEEFSIYICKLGDPRGDFIEIIGDSYPTEERAKEVMGMIEERTKILIHLKTFGNLQYWQGEIKGDLQDLFVFTMPTE